MPFHNEKRKNKTEITKLFVDDKRYDKLFHLVTYLVSLFVYLSHGEEIYVILLQLLYIEQDISKIFS